MNSKINYWGFVAVAIQLAVLHKIIDQGLDKIWLLVIILPFLFFVLLNIFRYKKAAKKVLLSTVNFFSSKSTKRIEVDLSPDLLFDKVLSEIKTSGEKIRYVDSTERSILVSTKINFRTWGENIYFDIIDKGDTSELLIQSACPQIISYGKNDENIIRLVHNIEDSFTI
jgi:hypothetical protein